MRKGVIEVITGSMFSGKTHELIRRLRLCVLARKKVQVFKSYLDNRYKNTFLVTHDGFELESIPVKSSSEIPGHIASYAEVVGIDEAHFFDPGLVDVCEALANRGIRVIVAGLDLDYRGVPFDVVAQLLAKAEMVTKNPAICGICGDDAHYSQRLNLDNKDRVVVGAGEVYQPRCRRCFMPPNEAEKAKASADKAKK